MILVLRVTSAAALFAGALAALLFGHQRGQCALILTIALASLFWLVLPFLSGSERGRETRARGLRLLNNSALTVAIGALALAAGLHVPFVTAVPAVIAELLVLLAWLLSAMPTGASPPEGQGGPPGDDRAREEYLRGRSARLSVVFLAGGGSALISLGLSAAIRVPYLLIMLVALIGCLLTIRLMLRRTLPADSPRRPKRLVSARREGRKEAG